MSTASVRRPRPINWKSEAPKPLPDTLTFEAQPKLPQLPLPSVPDTLSRLKETLKPIAWSEDEFNAVLKKIDEFGTSQAPELQKHLTERAKQNPHWLEQWWDDGGYLGYRDSVVINVSYYYGFDNSPSHLSQTPISRAAGITRATMLFRQQLKQGLIKPEGTKEGPLCMDTYRWMFDCSRVPGGGLDWSVSHGKAGDKGDSGHIIVIRNNRVWKVDVAHKGRILSTQEIERQLQLVVDNTTRTYPGVGVLAASNRDVWSRDYTELSSNPTNTKILEAIHSSAFVVSLESSRPSDPVHHSRALWHGDIVDGVPTGLQNRWVDKPVQFIVFDNGHAGLMGEHSIMDGTPTARMCDEMLDALYNPAFDHGTSSDASSLIPQPLDWHVSDATSQAIKKADKAAVELIESQELGYFLTSYGKDAIKKFGVSPDSWAQMIVQLAYRRLSGDKRTGATYEAATTRKFYKGRTEAIRVVSSESDAWVKSMDDPHATPEARKGLFDQATKKHISLAKTAGQGQGVDRHLFGLKMVWKQGQETKDKPLPALFSDPVFVRSSNWVLSTSAIFSKHFPVYGWGEVVPDGFGVAYMTGYEGG
ncbi:acyltransferase ChoActase/COT/CPT [Crepidotus variabilis]|uniref:Acyltransferase ChoActase/COT/CPT n=1 Tax=Crepidotus variabilis TaxID=179855 RepID=A0A9P6JTC9_9AGAR|nr:acyltransferase ChoActase/COT/CPT [Crepidotus variabilis]